jgi:hypothetical protein
VCRYTYLRCLQVLCCPKGIPIKRNQMSIMKHLRMNRERKGVLELYTTEHGLKVCDLSVCVRLRM